MVQKRLALIAVALCGWVQVAAADLVIHDGYVRGLPPTQSTTAAFMRLVNTGTSEIVIDGAATNAAARAEIHAHLHRDGMMSMQRVESITVPAGGEFVLEPGEHHLMLIDLKRPLREGDSVSIELFSGNTLLVNAELPVRSVLREHQHH